MKRFLALLLLALSIAGAHAANPSFSSFSQTDFTTNGLIIRLRSTNLLTGFVSTNYFLAAGTNIVIVTTVDGTGTNVTMTINTPGGGAGDTLWRTNALGLYLPAITNTSTIVVGQNAEAWWSPNAADGFVSIHDSSAGDSLFNAWAIAAIDNVTQENYAQFSGTLGSSNSVTANMRLLAATNWQNPSAPWSEFLVGLDPLHGNASMQLRDNGALLSMRISSNGIASLTTTDATLPIPLHIRTVGVGNLELGANDTNRWLISGATGNFMAADDSVGSIGENGAGRPASVIVSDFLEGQGMSDGVNYSQFRIKHQGTNNTILVSSQSAGTAGVPRPFEIDRNLGATLAVGSTTAIDMFQPSATNALSGALTFAHATNGTHLVEWTHVRTLYNGSGSDQTINLPSGWHKGSGAGSSFVVTNATLAKLYVTCTGPTGSAALQTNVTATVSFFP